VNEAHPERTVVKTTQLRRLSGKSDAMTDGKENDIRSVVARTLRDW
jgi:hypothetical protein